jgi:sugar transferase EpsL
MNFKRILDIIVSFLGLIILSPILAVVAVMVRVYLGKPVLFTQTRPGLYGKPFRIYKFRTMLNGIDEAGKLLPNKDRLTKIGSFLRKTSLDELPELFNIIKGDMSIVGPRPLLLRYLDRYTSEQARRHEVKPGLTGWAQVNGRNAISWEEKFKLDVWYVDNCSLWLDMKIIWMTVKKVLMQEGINAEGEATMAEFFPNESPFKN